MFSNVCFCRQELQHLSNWQVFSTWYFKDYVWSFYQNFHIGKQQHSIGVLSSHQFSLRGEVECAPSWPIWVLTRPIISLYVFCWRQVLISFLRMFFTFVGAWAAKFQDIAIKVYGWRTPILGNNYESFRFCKPLISKSIIYIPNLNMWSFAASKQNDP